MAVEEDKLNILAIVTIGIASVLLLWASIVALQAYYEATFGEEVKRQQTVGQRDTLSTILSEQRQRLGEYRRGEDGETARIPIEEAKRIVITELREGSPTSLVPAVGDHDTPTEAAVWGRPDELDDDEDVDDEDVDEEDVGEDEGDEQEGDEEGPTEEAPAEDAAAEDAETDDPAGVAPGGAEPSQPQRDDVDLPQEDPPSGAREQPAPEPADPDRGPDPEAEPAEEEP